MPVTFNINGNHFKGGNVPAVEAGLIGFYHDGKPWKPCPVAVRALLPANWRHAFDRDGIWWFKSEDDSSCHSQVTGIRGRHLTTIYAHAVLDE